MPRDPLLPRDRPGHVAGGAQGASPALTVVLTSANSGSLPAPGEPSARVVLSVSQPRLRRDGYFVSIVRVRRLVLPEHQSYFLLVTFGVGRKYLCEGDRCRGVIPWVYSPHTLDRMRTSGAFVEAFIHAPSNHIWSVAAGWLDTKKLVLPAAVGPRPERTQAAVLSARLTAGQVASPPSGTRTDTRGSFSADIWPYRDGSSFRFGLSVRGLSGPPQEAHVHTGAPGRRGPVLITLCDRGRCNITSKTFRGLPAGLVETMRVLGAYVDVHTKRNPRGELRGQIVLR